MSEASLTNSSPSRIAILTFLEKEESFTIDMENLIFWPCMAGSGDIVKSVTRRCP
jgi:hypothetical protein